MVTIDLNQARELLAFFGDEDARVCVSRLDIGGHSGPGVYAWLEEHPDEGSVRLDSSGDLAIGDELWAWLKNPDGMGGTDGR